MKEIRKASINLGKKWKIDDKRLFLVLNTTAWGVIGFLVAASIYLFLGFRLEDKLTFFIIVTGYSAVGLGFLGGIIKMFRE